ncbi:MAG: GNAT family N-acetyltransferase [bacterium]
MRLDDGSEATVRFLTEDDAGALADMFARLSYDTRKFLYDDVTDRRVVEGWTRDIDPDKALPVVAEVGGRIVADATLHRRQFGPLRHVGRVRVVVLEEWQGRGIAGALVRMLEEIARETGLLVLSCMLVKGEEDGAIRGLEAFGFERAAELPGYIMDPEGNVFDAVLLIKRLEE